MKTVMTFITVHSFFLALSFLLTMLAFDALEYESTGRCDNCTFNLWEQTP